MVRRLMWEIIQIGLDFEVLGPAIFTLGKNVMIGPDVLFITINHRFDRTDIPVEGTRSSVAGGIVVEDDVWIGARYSIAWRANRHGSNCRGWCCCY